MKAQILIPRAILALGKMVVIISTLAENILKSDEIVLRQDCRWTIPEVLPSKGFLVFAVLLSRMLPVANEDGAAGFVKIHRSRAISSTCLADLIANWIMSRIGKLGCLCR